MGQESRDWQTVALGQDPSPPPVCANKVLLEPSHIHSSAQHVRLLSSYKDRMSSCDRDCMAHKAPSIYEIRRDPS